MKSTKLKGVALLTDADIAKLDGKISSRLTGNSLCKGMDYKIIGFAKVDASTTTGTNPRTIPEWVGLLLVDKNGKEIVVGLNTVLGVSFIGTSQTGFTSNYVTKRLFNNITELKNAFEKCIKVTNYESLEAQIFDSEHTRMKDFPILEMSSANITYVEGAEIINTRKKGE